MPLKNLTLTTVTVVIFLLACNRNMVSLDYTNANDEVPALGNLVFRFDRPLVGDSLINQWDSTDYVSFEPKIPGKFRWEHPDELVFSPSRPLQPATNYKASLKSEILQYSKYDKIGNSDKISFHTADLKLENTNTAWVLPDPNSKTALPQVDLTFNYAVNPNTLKEKLKIEVNGQPQSFILITLSSSRKISLQLVNIKMEDKDLDAKLTVGRDLVPEGGTNGTASETSIKSVIPSPFILRINDVSAEQNGSGGTIRVSTSQQISSPDISTFIKLKPGTKFSVESTDEGFTISSDNFEQDKSYMLTIAKGLKGKIGGVLQDNYTTNLAFGLVEPSISFANSKGLYLSAKGEKNIEIRISNVEKLKIVVSKIYENNLVIAQKYTYYPMDSYNGGEDQPDYNDYGTVVSPGDIIYQEEIETRTLPKYGNSRILNFNIEDKLKDQKGVYHIMLRSSKDYWVRDTRFLSLSDIGLIAKQGDNKVVVFANSIKTANAMQGVNVVAYGANNQVLGLGSTNSEGIAEIQYARKEFAGFRPAMVVAKTADDFNYLPFNITKVNTSRFEVGGRKSNNTGLDAYVYPERDIYRPGERVNFAVVVRDRLWKSPGDIPLKLKFLLPNGKELKTFRKNLNSQGAVEGNIDIAEAAITGTYSLEVYSSNDILLTTQPFKIEEFVPDRIKLTATLDHEFLQPGDNSQLDIHAVNFFGPPAANRNYECEIQIKQKSFDPKKYRDYIFELANQNSFFDKIVRQGKTDDQGNAVEKYEVPSIYQNLGLLQAGFYSTVFDETGRPVSRITTADIFTQAVFFGVKDDGSWYYPMNQPVKFNIIALDKNEKLLSNTSAKVEVIRKEYNTVLTKSGGYFRYESQMEDKLMETNFVTVGGENTFYPFVPKLPGEYEVRVFVPGANSYVSKNFYSYGYDGGNGSFDVNNEGQIEIQPDKTTYEPGESAKILFKAPFNGRMLVTMETNKVISYQYVNVENRSVSLDLKINAEELPNVYVTATLFKPHDISDIPLTVAHGFQSLKVEEKERKQDVEIVAQKTVRSHTRQKVTIKASPNSIVTLAAVDNGVLQVSDFVTPDPYNYFYGKRALEVNAFDIYPLLLPEIKPRLSSTGGDGETDLTKRVNPMPAKRIKILSYWSGIRQTNGSGEAEFEFDVPQFSGQLRLMAVAVKNDQFGSSEANLTVADPIVLSSALPRFLSPRDTVTVPLTISNTTSRSANATATIRTNGTVQVQGAAQQTVDIAANSEGRVAFNVVADPAIGTGKVTIDVNSMGEKFTDETEISVRPPSSLQKITGSGSIAGGTSQTLPFNNTDFIPSSVRNELVISRSPLVELGKYFNFLVQYPYGCTEQTVSIAFPQLYFSDIANLIHAPNASQAATNSNIQDAIRKIKMRQLYNGGVMLWDDEDTENWWVTIYAAHFLLEAQKAGYDVDKSLIETMLNFVNNSLKSKKLIPYFYNRNQNRKIVPKEVIYGLYVLAIAGRPNISVMNYYKSNPSLLSLDCKYLLAAAYAAAGDQQSFKQFLPTQFAGEESIAQSGGSFYSDIRDESIALNVLIDADPANPQIPLMAKHVSEKLKGRYWYSTQEIAFSFLALGKIARQASKSTATAEIKSDGKTIASANGEDLKLNSAQLKGGNIEINAKGNGRLYYFWQEEGISVSGNYKEEDNYIKVRKHFFDRYGHSINGSVFKQNDLVIVEITLQKTYSTPIENIVITDLLPAGFEIENPRTKEIPGMDWIKDASTPTAIDVRDDRINLFVDATRDWQTYYYAVRAVSPGVYHMGPVGADAMYNGEYHSYNGAGIIKVVQ